MINHWAEPLSTVKHYCCSAWSSYHRNLSFDWLTAPPNYPAVIDVRVFDMRVQVRRRIRRAGTVRNVGNPREKKIVDKASENTSLISIKTVIVTDR